jgi:hypothetical protein
MVVRTVIKKRVGPNGIEIDCEDNQSRWVDIKETKTTKYEQAKGFRYRKTIYRFDNASERRTYDDTPDDQITIKDPDNEATKIEYLSTKGPNHGTIKHLWIEAGKGKFYQKTRLHFVNTEENEIRRVREQRVENPETGDHIMVERIERFTLDWGKGYAFQRKRVVPTNDEDTIEQSEGDCKVIE